MNTGASTATQGSTFPSVGEAERLAASRTLFIGTEPPNVRLLYTNKYPWHAASTLLIGAEPPNVRLLYTRVLGYSRETERHAASTLFIKAEPRNVRLLYTNKYQ